MEDHLNPCPTKLNTFDFDHQKKKHIFEIPYQTENGLSFNLFCIFFNFYVTLVWKEIWKLKLEFVI